MMADYPWIPREYYPAVIGACKMIRDTGYFNKSVSYYAEKYNVDSEELAKHIRARQAAGQKGRNTGRKYKWFIVVQSCWSEASSEFGYSNPEILKGLSATSVVKRFSEADFRRTVRNDYGGSYAPVFSHKAIAEFETEADAKKALSSWKSFL